MDIKKQLVLEVSLGTQKLKSEIAGLKKDLESVGRQMSGGAGTAAAKKSGVSADLEKAKQINMVYKQRQKEQDQIEKAYSQRQKEITREQEKATRELNKISTKKENEARKEAQRLEKQTEKEIKQNETAVEKEQQAKIKAEQKEAKRAEQQRTKDFNAEKKTIQERFEFLKKKNLEYSIHKSQLDRSVTARLARAFGVSDDKARGLAEAMSGGMGTGGINGKPSSPRGPSGIGMAIAAIAGLGSEIYNFSQFRRTQNAQMAASQVSAIKSGDYVGANIQGFRSTKHGIGRVLADIGTSVATGAGAGATVGGVAGGGVFSLPSAGIGGLIGAAGGLGYGLLKAGRSYLTGQQEERDRLMLETQPARLAQERQRQLSNLRFDMLRQTGRTMGGVNPLDRMTVLQGMGTKNGFSQEETLSQLGTLRQYIGTNAASNSLYGAQKLYNQTGINIGTQGRLAENITGAERGTFEQGNQKLEGIIRKGMAFGIKDGKLDQYARITADVVQRNSEMGGQQDATAIANELASRARGLVGMEGDITESSLSQAAGIQDLIRQKSSQTGGLSGAANFLGAMDAAKQAGLDLSPAQLMLIAQTSNKGEAALKETLISQGLDKDKVGNLDLSYKSNLQDQLKTEDKATNQVLANMLYGTTTEKTLDIQKSGLGYKADENAINLSGRGTAQAGAEGTLIQKNLEVDFRNFQLGLDNIGISTKLVNSNLEKFNENLQQSFKIMNDFLNGNGNLSK